MGRQNWSLSIHKDWNKVTFYDYSLKNRLKLAVESGFETFDAVVTRHWLCGSNLPEFMWRIPVGKPDYDKDDLMENGKPYLRNSLGGLIWNLGQEFFAWTSNDLEKDKVHEIFVNDEDIAVLAPDWADFYEDKD